tara:strand:- start:313 stop:933 length:621 start_codon:yes stop_codon:yes gene_type:complete
MRWKLVPSMKTSYIPQKDRINHLEQAYEDNVLLEEAKEYFFNLPEDIRNTLTSENQIIWRSNIKDKNNKWRHKNQHNPNYQYLFKKIKGEAIYKIYIEGRYYICVHRGPLYTCLKYHLERGFRDFHDSNGKSQTVISAYSKHSTYTIEKFLANGGEISLLENNLPKTPAKIKNAAEYKWIDFFIEKYGRDKVWNIPNKHSKFKNKK